MKRKRRASGRLLLHALFGSLIPDTNALKEEHRRMAATAFKDAESEEDEMGKRLIEGGAMIHCIAFRSREDLTSPWLPPSASQGGCSTSTKSWVRQPWSALSAMWTRPWTLTGTHARPTSDAQSDPRLSSLGQSHQKSQPPTWRRKEAGCVRPPWLRQPPVPVCPSAPSWEVTTPLQGGAAGLGLGLVAWFLKSSSNSALMPHAAFAGASAARGISTYFCGMRLKMEVSLAPLKPREAPETWQAGPWLFDIPSRPAGRDCRLLSVDFGDRRIRWRSGVRGLQSKIRNRQSSIVNQSPDLKWPTPGRLRSPPHASNVIPPSR